MNRRLELRQSKRRVFFRHGAYALAGERRLPQLGGPMPEDWILSRIAAVEQAAALVSRGLAEVPRRLDEVRRARMAGVPLPTIARSLAEAGTEHREIAANFLAYQRSVAALRAAVVRALVDDEAIPLSELAAVMGISRQAVGRIYRAGRQL